MPVVERFPLTPALDRVPAGTDSAAERGLAVEAALNRLRNERDAPGDDCSWVWLRPGPANLMLNDMHEPSHRPQAPDPARARAHGDTGLYLGADVDAVCAYLRSRGQEVDDPVVRDYGMRQLAILDPNGYST